jgi:hypothetical protein
MKHKGMIAIELTLKTYMCVHGGGKKERVCRSHRNYLFVSRVVRRNMIVPFARFKKSSDNCIALECFYHTLMMVTWWREWNSVGLVRALDMFYGGCTVRISVQRAGYRDVIRSWSYPLHLANCLDIIAIIARIDSIRILSSSSLPVTRRSTLDSIEHWQPQNKQDV